MSILRVDLIRARAVREAARGISPPRGANNDMLATTDWVQRLVADRIAELDFADQLLPIGSVVAFAGESLPANYFLCGGQAISRSEYSDLFSILGVMYGDGDGTSTFNLPDYRGQFLRGWGAATADPGAGGRTDRGDGTEGNHVGTKQATRTQRHKHELPFGASYPSASWLQLHLSGGTPRFGSTSGTFEVQTTGGLRGTEPGYIAHSGLEIFEEAGESRPPNINVMYLIRAK